MRQWVDDNPYYLLIRLDDHRMAEIDLGETGWAKRFKSFLRAPGQWYLVRKEGGVIVATMLVRKGEQPYYVARHVGIASIVGDKKIETINYGIGKKRIDGHVDRIWIMANGCVALGDDVEPISLDLLKSGLL